MDLDCFIFNGVRYYTGTIVKIKENEQKNLGYHSRLVFKRYNEANELYRFASLYDIWERYELSKEQILHCVESIDRPLVVLVTKEQKLDPRYIDGIVSAWIWYILIMVFALFIKGFWNTIILWAISTITFFKWRNDKINGR